MQNSDLDIDFDRALCRNWEPDDTTIPVRDGTQYVGGKPAASQNTVEDSKKEVRED